MWSQSKGIMKVLLVGVGGVGEAIAAIAKERSWVEQVVLADYNKARAEEVQKKLGDPKRFPVEFIDAGKQENIEELARKYSVDLIMNSVDPEFNEQIFEAAYNVGAIYMDMAMTLSEPNATDPFHKVGVKLGDYQFEKAKDWEKKGLLAIVGLGVEPGMADVFRVMLKIISSMRSGKSAFAMARISPLMDMSSLRTFPFGQPSRNVSIRP